MQRISRTIHHGVWLLVAIAAGIGAATLLINLGKLAYSYGDITTAEQHNQEIDSGEKAEVIVVTSPQEDQYYMIGTVPNPSLSAKAYLVADLETGDILFSEGRKVSLPIASVTKLMTAVVAKTLTPEPSITKVSQSAVETEGYRGELAKGDELSIDELIYPLLLVSSNDASEAIAEHFDRDNFMKQMNARAVEFGMRDTHFEDPSGLSSSNISTADDLFILLKQIDKRYSDILETSQKKSYKADGHSWQTKNKLLSFEPYFDGGKTGYTSNAKQTGAGIFEIPLSGDVERRIGIIILGSDERENDIAQLIRYTQKYIHYGNQKSLKELYPEAQI